MQYVNAPPPITIRT